MPGFAFSSQHEENQEWNECHFKKQRVQRSNTANNQVAHNSAVTRRFELRRRLRILGWRYAIDAMFDAADLSFHGIGGVTQHTAIFRPAFGKIRYAGPQPIAYRADHRTQQKHHDHGADSAWNMPAFQKFDDWIEAIRQKNRQH
jgi:hypothetical protein